MTIETATITVPKIRDNDGQPTCRWWGQHCPFLMHSGFGTREHCFWMEGSGKHRPQLERREHGIGTTIPHQQCPVWEVQPLSSAAQAVLDAFNAARREPHPGIRSHRTTTMSRTATDAYAMAHAEAMALIERLRDMIQDMPEPETPGIDWTHAGSLNHVNAQLRVLLGFVES